MDIFELAKSAKEIASKWVEAELINESYRGNFEQGFVLGHNQLSDGLFEVRNNSYAASQVCSAEAYATQLGYLAGQEFRKSDRTPQPIQPQEANKMQLIEDLAQKICCIDGVEEASVILPDPDQPNHMVFSFEVTSEHAKTWSSTSSDKLWKAAEQLISAAHEQLVKATQENFELVLDSASFPVQSIRAKILATFTH